MLKHINECKSVNIEAGKGASMQMLISPETAPNFAMRKFTIKSGGYMPNHTNTVEHEQYVLAGSAKVGIGKKIHEAKKDDILFIPKGVPHWYEVTGSEDYEFLCLVPNEEDKIEIIS